MGTQLTKNEPKSHKFTKSKNWAHQIYQQIHQKARFTNALRALLITRRPQQKSNQLLVHTPNSIKILKNNNDINNSKQSI